MLRIFSSKIFREDLSEYALPMWAFEKFDDIERIINIKNGTYKFCLPVSIGDFAEVNVPACFSNDVEELRNFVKKQTRLNSRKAFIISDFQVLDLSQVCFSGTICVSSKKGLTNFWDKTTTIGITLKNPILTYGQEGISPRDLPADVQLTYDHVSNSSCAFPKIDIKAENFDLEQYKDVIYQAYMASTKIHEVSEKYDGQEYEEHILFFIDDKWRIRLYEIIGRESFCKEAKCDMNMIRRELEFVSLLSDSNNSSVTLSEKPFCKSSNSLCKKRAK